MKPRTTTALVAVVAVLTCNLTSSARAADKPAAVPVGHADFVPTTEHPIGFRGDGQGCYPGATPPIEWWDGTPVKREIALEGKPTLMWDHADTKSKNILWKVPAPGWGFAHPIVVPAAGGTGGKRIYTVGHPYWVACYDADTGKELWKRAMTPMLAAGMKAEKAEALRKVCDLASAFFILNHQQKQGDAVFLFQKPSKEEAKDPDGVVKTKIETGTKALAMIAKFRGDVEAVGDPELVTALDKDVAAIELMLDLVRKAAPSEVLEGAFWNGDEWKNRFYNLNQVLEKKYDIPLTLTWIGYVGWADAALASDGERIYGTLAQGQIFAYDLDGNLLWAHQEGGSKIGNYYNFNRPPVVREGLVMQRPQGHTLPARWRGYDAKTGEIRWEVPVGKSAWNYAAPIVLDLPTPDGMVVPVLVTPNGDSYDAATKTGKGPAFIRVRDGKVLGYLPGFNTQTGVQMTWHPLPVDHPAAQGRLGAGILVCAPNADGCKPTWAFRVWMKDAQTVTSDVWWDDSSPSVVTQGQMFPVGFGPYRVQGDYRTGIADVVTKKKASELPLHRAFKECATLLGRHLVGMSNWEGQSTASATYGRSRADRKVMESFAVVDVTDVERPRLLSNRNLLGYDGVPADSVIATYLAAWDPLHFTTCYKGSPSQFGTDLGGVVGHGERIYIQSTAHIYCIGPAVKGTPKDDPKVVAEIRAAKSADEVVKYLESDSAQYRWEAVKKVSGVGVSASAKASADTQVSGGSDTRNLTPEVISKLESLARTDPYEEIRAVALRILGLQEGKPGAVILAELMTKEIGLTSKGTTQWDGTGDIAMTIRVLGSEATAALPALKAIKTPRPGVIATIAAIEAKVPVAEKK